MTTEREMLTWLRARYGTLHGNGARWVFATHVRSHAGFDARRTADAVAMDLWPSKGLELHGHEVKCSRGDWLRELKDARKHAEIARYCQRWWLVVPDAAIVRDGELPADWGLLVAGPGGVRAVRKAPRRRTVPVTPTFMAAMLRAAVKTAQSDAARQRVRAA